MTRSYRPFVLPGLVTLVGVAVLIGLGFWQIERGGAKNRLIARVEARLGAAPEPLPPEAAWSAFNAKSDEYRRVRARGVFDHAHEAHLYTSLPPDAGALAGVAGYLVLTPLRLDGGGTVIVDRGFVPLALKGAATRAAGQVVGEVTVTGLLRAPEWRNPFVPADDTVRNVWFARDPAAITRAYSLTRVAPFVLAADATPVPGGWPRGGFTRVTFPNNHLQYAITWFTLALALLAVFVVWARARAEGGGRARIDRS